MRGKAQIRQEQRQLRQQLGLAEIRHLSGEISRRFLDWLSERPHISHIHLFFPIDRLREVDTFSLFGQLKNAGFTLYTSAVKADKNTLATLEITHVGDFGKDALGIPSPIGAFEVAPDKIQLVVVPLLAFDGKGSRLGYGKGYYDGFLSGLDPGVLKVGFNFFGPVSGIPAEAHDVGLDFCITPSQVFGF